jgi:hypothetical protein
VTLTSTLDAKPRRTRSTELLGSVATESWVGDVSWRSQAGPKCTGDRAGRRVVGQLGNPHRLRPPAVERRERVPDRACSPQVSNLT